MHGVFKDTLKQTAKLVLVVLNLVVEIWKLKSKNGSDLRDANPVWKWMAFILNMLKQVTR